MTILVFLIFLRRFFLWRLIASIVQIGLFHGYLPLLLCLIGSIWVWAMEMNNVSERNKFFCVYVIASLASTSVNTARIDVDHAVLGNLEDVAQAAVGVPLLVILEDVEAYKVISLLSNDEPVFVPVVDHGELGHILRG